MCDERPPAVKVIRGEQSWASVDRYITYISSVLAGTVETSVWLRWESVRLSVRQTEGSNGEGRVSQRDDLYRTKRRW